MTDILTYNDKARKTKNVLKEKLQEVAKTGAKAQKALQAKEERETKKKSDAESDSPPSLTLGEEDAKEGEEVSSALSKNQQKKLNKKLKDEVNSLNKKKPRTPHGYMYIGHLPHGFYEEELKSYFSQFGRIVRIRLARAKATGQHKGYGFIEFADSAVAAIAAETMNNYLMFNKILKCHLIPKEKLNPLTFKNANKKFFVGLRSFVRRKYNRKRSDDQLKQMKERRAEKMKKREDKLKALGINLDLSKLLTESQSLAEIKSSPSASTTKPTANTNTKKRPAAATQASTPAKSEKKPTEKKPAAKTVPAKKMKSKK